MDLSIIIVSWNVQELLKKNLATIFGNNQNINFEVFVVDNNSSDNTIKMIKNNFPQVKLIQNKDNLGFAKANNIAIKKSQGRYVLLLNPDMKIDKDSLREMVKWMDNDPKIGIGGCKLIDQNNKIIKHIRHFPSFFDQLMIILKIPHLFPAVLNRYIIHNFNYEQEAIVDSIRGAFFMVRREVITKIGELDEQFFLWFEEVDYCRQVKNSKWNVSYNPNVKCYDYVGQSFSQVKRGITQKYFRDSMLKYFRKWHSGLEYFILKIVWFFVGIITFKR